MTNTLSNVAYEYLRERLLDGRLHPGTRLVNRTLAKEIGISFTPVREAIGRLASEGVVVQVPGAGAFVRELSRDEIISLFGFRTAIECYAATQAAKKIDDHQIERLDAICRDWDQLLAQRKSNPAIIEDSAYQANWRSNDVLFHGVVYESAQNAWMAKIVRDLRMMSSLMIVDADKLKIEDAQNTIEHHKALTDALRRRDETAAESLMKAQMQAGLKVALDSVAKRSPSNSTGW